MNHDGTVIENVNKTIESEEKNRKENKKKKNTEQSLQNGIQGVLVGESTFKASTEKTNDNKRGRTKSTNDSNSQRIKRNRNTETSWEKKNGDSDSDTSLKKSIPKKNHKRRISDSDFDDKDPSDEVPKKNTQRRMKEGGMHWLQDKNRIILEMNGIHWRDHFMMEKFHLNDNNFITTKQVAMSLPAFEHKNAKQILCKKQYQNEEEGKA